MTRFRLLLAAAAALPLMAACENGVESRPCSTEVRPGILVGINDNEGNAAAIGASVIAREGAYVDSVRVAGTNNAVLVGLANERPGTYTVTVRKPGYQVVTNEGVVVTQDRCHVRTVTLVVTLQP